MHRVNFFFHDLLKSCIGRYTNGFVLQIISKYEKIKGMRKKYHPFIRIAVFDIDGTIFRSSLLIELIDGLVEAGTFPRHVKKEVEKDYVAWLNRKGSYERYVDRVVETYMQYIKGCKKKDVERIANTIIQIHKNRVYRFTRDFIRELKREKYYLIAISGSPIYMVSRFSKKLGFHAYFGEQLEVKKGIFTGRTLSTESIHAKDKILKQFIAISGMRVDLGRSIAVGDTQNDIPMMKMVGNPIAFNPNTSLAHYAKEHKWDVVVERKDVIYKFTQFSFING